MWDILSASFLPSIQDDVLLFQEQNKFMYDIFLTILETPMGIHFVHVHYVTRNGWAIWKDLASYMHTSTRADIFTKTY